MAENQGRRKRKYTKQEAQKAMPAVKEFNKLAAVFLKLLNQKVEQKQKRLSTISVLVNEISVKRDQRSMINIQTVDMKQTIVKKAGLGAFNQTMNWEDDYRKNRRKGVIL